jgi:hypothetical protein
MIEWLHLPTLVQATYGHQAGIKWTFGDAGT